MKSRFSIGAKLCAFDNEFYVVGVKFTESTVFYDLSISPGGNTSLTIASGLLEDL